MFADASLPPYLAMAGLDGDKPFECTGTEGEVRSAIAAAGAGGRDHPALTPALRDAAITGARPLDVLLKDWGQDDLMSPALRDRVRRAASR
ncbi:MAG TPA: hypothetical protein VH478_11030 [Trebonia sp.]|nr:hypothetical protein [Trebonia sp.]